jgi:hypothetical protein
MSYSKENQQRTEQLVKRQDQINIELERLERARRGLEQGSPEWTLIEEKQKRLIWDFESINDELNSIQVEEDLRELKRLGWKLAETKTINGAVIKKYVPPESSELIN